MGLVFTLYREGLSEAELSENAKVVDAFHTILRKSPLASKARDYLMNKRGLSWGTVEDFRLGYCPSTEVEGIPALFKNRLVIPIEDHHGKVVALSSRQVPGDISDGEGPKYLHTPFKAGDILFNLVRAKKAIISSDMCFIVEGFFDAITLWDGGVRNVVAVMGARMSQIQASLILRYTTNTAWIPDHDEPGMLGCQKAVKMLSSQPFAIKAKMVKYSQDYKDIDEFLRSGDEGAGSLLKQLKLCKGFLSQSNRAGSKKIKEKMESVLGRLQCNT